MCSLRFFTFDQRCAPKKKATRAQKRTLAGTRPSDGKRFRTHVAQSEIIDLIGLGGAAAAPAV